MDDRPSLRDVLMLTLSNAGFLLAAGVAAYRRLYTSAICYFFVACLSSMYHACTEGYYCFTVKPDYLAVLDFYSALAALWVTVVTMAWLPAWLFSFLTFGGPVLLLFGVLMKRTSPILYIVPLVVGAATIIGSWVFIIFSRPQRRIFPPWRWHLLHFVPGGLLALSAYVFFYLSNANEATQANYGIWHSLWHASIAVAITFMLPQPHNWIRLWPGDFSVRRDMSDEEQDTDKVNLTNFWVDVMSRATPSCVAPVPLLPRPSVTTDRSSADAAESSLLQLKKLNLTFMETLRDIGHDIVNFPHALKETFSDWRKKKVSPPDGNQSPAGISSSSAIQLQMVTVSRSTVEV